MHDHWPSVLVGWSRVESFAPEIDKILWRRDKRNWPRLTRKILFYCISAAKSINGHTPQEWGSGDKYRCVLTSQLLPEFQFLESDYSFPEFWEMIPVFLGSSERTIDAVSHKRHTIYKSEFASVSEIQQSIPRNNGGEGEGFVIVFWKYSMYWNFWNFRTFSTSCLLFKELIFVLILFIHLSPLESVGEY